MKSTQKQALSALKLLGLIAAFALSNQAQAAGYNTEAVKVPWGNLVGDYDIVQGYTSENATQIVKNSQIKLTESIAACKGQRYLVGLPLVAGGLTLDTGGVVMTTAGLTASVAFAAAPPAEAASLTVTATGVVVTVAGKLIAGVGGIITGLAAECDFAHRGDVSMLAELEAQIVNCTSQGKGTNITTKGGGYQFAGFGWPVLKGSCQPNLLSASGVVTQTASGTIPYENNICRDVPPSWSLPMNVGVSLNTSNNTYGISFNSGQGLQGPFTGEVKKGGSITLGPSSFKYATTEIFSFEGTTLTIGDIDPPGLSDPVFFQTSMDYTINYPLSTCGGYTINEAGELNTSYR